MSEQKLNVVSNGTPAVFAFNDTSFTVKRDGSDKTKLDVPLYRVLWAEHSERFVAVHVLAKKGERLVRLKAEGTVDQSDKGRLQQWTEALLDAAYAGAPRQKSLLVIINPHGGTGRAKFIYKTKVEPILRIARCSLDTIYTTHHGHAMEIASTIDLEKYNAVLSVSGDGIIHEIFNGFAKHKEPVKAFKIPVAPIPAGSGNGLSLNLIGVEEGQDVAAAALNAVKGRPMAIDICSILQKGKRSFSFMSQCVGLMADLDLGTEHLRWMGSNRFVYGYLRAVVTRKVHPFSISIKAVETDKVKMTQMLESFHASVADGTSSPPDQPKQTDTTLPPMKYSLEDTVGWITFEKPILYFYAGKGPYVSRDLMQFPVSMPNEGAIDVVVQESTSRKEMLATMDGAEHGKGYWLDSCNYFKAEAFRVKPLTSTGYLSVDGEKFPFEEFLVEVHQGLGTLLSRHGRYASKFVIPPKS